MSAAENIRDVELDLLGAALADPTTTEIALAGDQFEDPTSGIIWETIRRIHRSGRIADPLTVAQEATECGARVDHTNIVPLFGRGMVVDARVYADAITSTAARRAMATVIAKAQAQLGAGEPLDTIARTLGTAGAAATGAEAEVEKACTLGEFTSVDLPEHDWVIPGLLDRGDRLVLTGAEGLGKSYLMRQMAACAAAGIHPFDATATQPRTVLVVDAENPLRIMVQSWRQLGQSLERLKATTGDRLWITRYPQGLDLGSEHDRLALHELCRAINPDLLVIGPAYKLYVGGAQQREEDLARLVTNCLDGLREEFGFALILEHHSPHAAPGQKRTVRPIGSSLWLRWPEFGIGLAPDDQSRPGHRMAWLKHWRGARDERSWPERIEQATLLPWQEAAPSGYPA